MTVLSREYCHLCHEMVAALRHLQECPDFAATSFAVQVIDVDEHTALEKQYGKLVPVLLAGEREICHYHLDRGALSAYLDEIR